MYELSRGESCSVSPTFFFTSCLEKTSPSRVRQLNSCLVHKQGEGSRSICFVSQLLGRFFSAWAGGRNIVLSAANIPRKRNILVGNLSRGRSNFRLTEWGLNQNIARCILHKVYYPEYRTICNLGELQAYCSPFPMDGVTKCM